jgi:hypothetical protein
MSCQAKPPCSNVVRGVLCFVCVCSFRIFPCTLTSKIYVSRDSPHNACCRLPLVCTQLRSLTAYKPRVFGCCRCTQVLRAAISLREPTLSSRPSREAVEVLALDVEQLVARFVSLGAPPPPPQSAPVYDIASGGERIIRLRVLLQSTCTHTDTDTDTHTHLHTYTLPHTHTHTHTHTHMRSSAYSSHTHS